MKITNSVNGYLTIQSKIQKKETDESPLISPDHYKKWSEHDDPLMFGDRRRNILNKKLRKKRKDTKLKNVLNTYPAFRSIVSLNEDVTLGMLEFKLGTIGIKETLKIIRHHSIFKGESL